jgi:hypothetical protein
MRIFPPSPLSLSILWFYKVGKSLWLLVVVVSVSMCVVAMGVWVVLRPDILHLQHVAALGAALDGSVPRHGQPDGDVGVGGEAGTAGVLLVAKGLDDDGVVERPWSTVREH